jgi:hypothetical protein
MAVRRRCSPVVCRSRSWPRQARCARGPRGQGRQKAEEDGGNEEAEGLWPRRLSMAAMVPVAEKTARLGFTLARWTARASAGARVEPCGARCVSN